MPLPNVLPADLPTNWTPNQIVSPDGVSVGLTPQHGYNTLNQYINNAQAAINLLREYLNSAGFVTGDAVAAALASYLPLAGGTLSGILDHGGKRDINLGAPTAATDGATKGYVDTKTGLLLPLAGGTMSGDIAFGNHKATGLATPTAAGDAATKGYVDTADTAIRTTANGALQRSGGTMTGIINHGGYRVTNIGTPSAGTDAATKTYVDNLVNAAAKIATGSYTGTGTYGQSNPCSLTFPFSPKVFLLGESGETTTQDGYYWSIWFFNMGAFYVPSRSATNQVTVTGTTISWYDSSNRGSGDAQRNQSGKTYCYAALG